MSKTLKDQSITAFLWVLIDKLGSSSINFGVTIILARLLSPEDFGIVAMVMIFFELSASFVDSGFSNALVREKTISEEDKSTTFIFNFVMAIIVYSILYVSAPAIATFFGHDSLIWLTRIMGLNLIIRSFAIIQEATLTQQIDFKTQTKVRIPSVIISGGIAILMALYGFGIWSLVAQLILRAGINTILLWWYCPWKISFVFSVSSFKRLFGFGSNILISGLIQRFFTRIFDLLIGKYFAAATLGFYTQAQNFCNLAINHLYQAVEKISYPVLSKLQDDIGRLKEGYRKFLKLSSFVIIPAMMILGVLAEPIIITLLGEKWINSVPFLQLLCMAGATYHFHVINLNILLVLGRSDLGLRLEILEKVSITLGIIIGIQFGIFGLVIGQVASSYVNLLVNTYYSDKFLHYSLFAQLGDIFPTIFFSLIMGVVLYYARQFLAPGLISLGLLGILGGTIYLGLHFLKKTEEFLLIQRVIIPKTLGLIIKRF